MNVQQILSLIIVALATAYLGRCVYRAWTGFRANRSGCESGCAGCGFASEEKAQSTVLIPLATLRPSKKERR